MGIPTIVIAALSFVLAVATIILPPPLWFAALYFTLLSSSLFLIFAMGWTIEKISRGTAMDKWWLLLPSCLSLAVIVFSFIFSDGPGLLLGQGHKTIYFPVWIASASGVAGAIACGVYGVLMICEKRIHLEIPGILCLAGSIFSIQPALKSIGFFHLGPIGIIAVAILVFLALFTVRKRHRVK